MNRDHSIRLATKADAKAIAVLIEQLGYSASFEAVHQRLARLVSRNDCLVAVLESDAGQICGWIQAQSSETLESGSRAEIVGLVIDRHMRRRGLGRMLVAAAESWATQMRSQAVGVRSNVERPESHPFYLALGYALVKTQNVYRKQLG